MLLLNQIKLLITENWSEDSQEEKLRRKVADHLHLPETDIVSIDIKKRSIDARKKPELYYVYSLAVALSPHGKKPEAFYVKKGIADEFHDTPYRIPKPDQPLRKRPVIIGAGPAGLFAALILAKAGAEPLILERGKSVEDRRRDVEDFFATGTLNPESNVQFGEGGAGTFSDGKLNTLVKDKFGRNRFVLETFVRNGANPQILYDKPHVGTDVLFCVLQNLRKEIENAGGSLRFESKVTDFLIENGKLTGLVINEKEVLEADTAILAIGHSARDTFEILFSHQVPMQAKEFAMGFRIEHPQEWLDVHQYGQKGQMLPAASYKLATKLENGRGVYSFCMCPGGYVVNSSSEAGHLTVNGMSNSARDSKNANSAIVVSVGRGEYSLDDPLAAISFQREMEKRAYELCRGKIPQQLLGDFRQNQVSTSFGSFESLTKGEVAFANLRSIFSDEINDSFLRGIDLFEHKIKGFSREDAILSGIEARTSSPVRISRDDLTLQSCVLGLYPCGEGAGYAGGIMSAAMDGMKTAEKILERQ